MNKETLYINNKSAYIYLTEHMYRYSINHQSGGDSNFSKIHDYGRYDLIGIGDFSHGDQNMWVFRFDYLKRIIVSTDKSVLIFTEDSKEHTDNIMKDTELRFEDEYSVTVTDKGSFPYGPLDRYSYRSWDSTIYLEIINYIRAHRDRIEIIGVDVSSLARDVAMSRDILKNLDSDKINLFWGANAHVDAREITESYELKWTPKERYRAGFYLKEELKERYLIVLSTGYEGTVRFSSVCDNDDCDERTYPKIPFYENFMYEPYRKYVPTSKYTVLNREQFQDPIIEFTDAKFPNDPFTIESRTWDYLIMFSHIDGLELIDSEKKERDV